MDILEYFRAEMDCVSCLDSIVWLIYMYISPYETAISQLLVN